jgi:hypothetical protein
MRLLSSAMAHQHTNETNLVHDAEISGFVLVWVEGGRRSVVGAFCVVVL